MARRITRYKMYEEIARSFPFGIEGKILGISDLDDIRHLINPKSDVIEVNYPEYDIHKLPFESESFDIVISDQILEHIKDPIRAVKETRRVLKKGGYAIHTTCFMNYYHPAPIDYWRFSPEALEYLCRDFSEVKAGGWGNLPSLLWCSMSDRLRGLDVNKFIFLKPFAKWNQKRYPISTWVVARK